MKFRLRAAALAPCVAIGCATTTPPAPPAPSMPDSTYLADRVRDSVRQAMVHHRRDVQGLLWSTLFLDLGRTSQQAEEIAQGTRLAQVDASGEQVPKDEMVPERMLKLDRDLANKAKDLQAAASENPASPDRLADAFGDMVKVCVRCHATYLYPADRIEPSAATP